MKTSLLPHLKCLQCDWGRLAARVEGEKFGEWRVGKLVCEICGMSYPLSDGIVDFLVRPSAEIEKERQGAHAEVRIRTREGESFIVNEESVRRFSHLFLSLPKGDGSYFFKEGGSFQNFAEGAHRFYEGVGRWRLRPGLKVLEIGAGFCWASRELAARGCEVTAVDICDYLKIADLYIERGLFFERIYADMDHLPFKDESFDVVFAAAAIHHSSDLKRTFRELRRVLKRSGRILLINECFVGLLEKPQVHPEEFAFNDHYYPVPHWTRAMKRSGFRNISVDYLSVFRDYVARKEARGSRPGFKLRLARAVISRPWLDGFLSAAFIPMRVAFRPKSVFIEATK